MTTINAPSLQDTVYSGECPLAVAHGYATLAGAAVGDKVRLNRVYAGTKVYDARMVTAALGAGALAALGFEYVNGEAGSDAVAFFAATDVSAASNSRTSKKPVTLQYDAYITATISGAAATGAIDTIVTYEFKGAI